MVRGARQETNGQGIRCVIISERDFDGMEDGMKAGRRQGRERVVRGGWAGARRGGGRNGERRERRDVRGGPERRGFWMELV